MTKFEIKLHPNQIQVYNSPERFKVLICGRRFGKTYLAAYSVILSALKKNNGVFFVVSPSYAQTKIIWRMIKRFLPREYIKKIMEGELYIELINGSLIFAKSGDNPESLRGEGLDGVVLDEAAFLRPEVWNEAIRPALADKMGWAIVISTPKGKNWLYELFLRGLDDTQPDYASFRFSSFDNPLVPQSEIEEMSKNLPELSYKQEICHIPQTALQLYGGKTITIMDCSVGDKLCYVSEFGEILPCKITDKKMTGIKEICVVTLENGIVQKASTGHKIQCSTGKNDIDKTDDIELVFKNKYNDDKQAALARLVAYCTGDGNITLRYATNKTKKPEVKKYPYYQVSFYSKYKEDLERVAEDLELTGICDRRPNITIRKTSEKYDDNWQIQINWKSAKRFLEYGAPIGKKVCTNFDIPDWIMNGSDSIKREYVAALWGAEGSTPSSREDSVNRACRSLVLSMNKHNPYKFDKYFEDFAKLHSDLGIKTTISQKQKDNYTIYRIYISPKKANTLKFLQTIGYRYCKKKEIAAFEWAQYYQSFFFDAEHRGDEAKKLRESGLSYSKIAKRLNCCLQQASFLVNKEFKEAGRGFQNFDEWIYQRRSKTRNSLFLKVISKTVEDSKEVYNITVDSPDHSYLLANGINNYNCAEFIEGGGVVFRNVDKVMKGYPEEPIDGVFYIMGVDLGRHEDFSVISVARTDQNRQVYRERFNQTDWDYIKERIRAVHFKYNRAPIIIDSTGYGDPIYEDLGKEGLNITGININVASKPKMIENLQLMIENNMIILINDKDASLEFSAYSYTILPSGNVRYEAPKGFHDDIVISTALMAMGLQGSGSDLMGEVAEVEDSPNAEVYNEIEDIEDWDDFNYDD